MRHEKPYMIACLRPLSDPGRSADRLRDLVNSGLGELPRTPNASIEQLLQQASQSKPEEAALLRLGSGPCLPAEGPRQVHRHPGTDSAGKPEAGPAGLRQYPERRTGPRPQQAQGRPAGIAASEHAASQRTAGDPAGSYPARQGPGRRRRPGPAAAKERIYFAPLLEGPAVIENQERSGPWSAACRSTSCNRAPTKATSAAG